MGSLIDHFPLTEKELKTYSALALAYIGDCVFDLVVRTILVSRGNDKPQAYHRRAIHFVNAAAQKDMMSMLTASLKEEEKAVFRRGRNAKGASPARNQSLHDYRIATGFEALLGYLYLSGQRERLYQLLSLCLQLLLHDSQLLDDSTVFISFDIIVGCHGGIGSADGDGLHGVDREIDDLVSDT